MKDIKIISLSKKELPQFHRYINRAFHRKYVLHDARYLQWQYDHMYVLWSKNAIVGHFGFRDTKYKIYVTTKWVRTLMNFYVLEPYRVFGLGAILARKVFDTRYPLFVSGYTPSTQKLGRALRPSWNDAGILTRYFAVLDDSTPFLLRYASHSALRELSANLRANISAQQKSIAVIQTSDIPFSKVWQKTKNRYSVTVERTDSYMNWRFKRHPMLPYSFLAARRGNEYMGYLVYRYEEDKGFKIARIIDFIAEPIVEESLIKTFLSSARHEGAHAADFFCSGIFYRSVFSKCGFFNIKKTVFTDFPAYFSPISIGRKTFINIAYDIKAPFSDCYFTRADGDKDRPNPH